MTAHRMRLLSLIALADAGIPARETEADALEAWRDRYGFTQAEAAQVLGLQQPEYSKVVSGHRRLPIVGVARAVAVGVPVAPLLADRSPLPPEQPVPAAADARQAQQENNTAPASELIDTGGIASLLGLTREYVTDRVSKEPDFPRPKQSISRRTKRWDKTEVEAWAASPRSQNRNRKGKKP